MTRCWSDFTRDGNAYWTEQDAGADLDYLLDWSDTMEPGDVIADSRWVAGDGLTVTQTSYDDTATMAWLSGGLGGRSYVVRNTILTLSGRTDTRTFRLFVRGDLARYPSVFPDLGTAVAELRRDRLLSVLRNLAPDVSLSDVFLADKLRVAEKSIERGLRVFLTPREIVPQGTPQATVDALEAAGEQVIEEPGYDWSGSGFTATWGALELRQRPLIKVHGISVVHPAQLTPLYEVPLSWILADKKYGSLNIVPNSTPTGSVVPLTGFILGTLAGNSPVPLLLRIRYRAGLTDAARDWPDLLAVIKRQAVLDILSDQFLPTSGSSSIDGMSQSLSFDTDKHQEALNHKLDALRSAIHGIRLMVL